MPNAALSAQHVASLILSASKDADKYSRKRHELTDNGILSCYIISKDRMERANLKLLLGLCSWDRI